VPVIRRPRPCREQGAAEIVGIPPELCELFSTRRREIEEELAARGGVSPQAARAAALDTRQAKDHSVDPGVLRGMGGTCLGCRPLSTRR
jgi:hypothetical protein